VGVWGSEKMITTISPYYISGSNHQGRGHQSSVTPFCNSLHKSLHEIILSYYLVDIAVKILANTGTLNRCLNKINKYLNPYSPVSRGMPPQSKKGIYAPRGIRI
tara:strand:+ start:21 stop:332 length:312 start_codon:yes stop_codon:yes gene_type:complete